MCITSALDNGNQPVKLCSTRYIVYQRVGLYLKHISKRRHGLRENRGWNDFFITRNHLTPLERKSETVYLYIIFPVQHYLATLHYHLCDVWLDLCTDFQLFLFYQIEITYLHYNTTHCTISHRAGARQDTYEIYCFSEKTEYLIAFFLFVILSN